MKQQKVMDYRPSYPRKALRGAALTAAALVAIGGAVGCQKVKLPEGLQTEGMVAIPEPTEELVLEGEVAISEPTEQPVMTTGVLLMPTPAPTATTEH